MPQGFFLSRSRVGHWNNNATIPCTRSIGRLPLSCCALLRLSPATSGVNARMKDMLARSCDVKIGGRVSVVPSAFVVKWTFLVGGRCSDRHSKRPSLQGSGDSVAVILIIAPSSPVHVLACKPSPFFLSTSSFRPPFNSVDFFPMRDSSNINCSLIHFRALLSDAHAPVSLSSLAAKLPSQLAPEDPPSFLNRPSPVIAHVLLLNWILQALPSTARSRQPIYTFFGQLCSNRTRKTTEPTFRLKPAETTSQGWLGRACPHPPKLAR